MEDRTQTLTHGRTRRAPLLPEAVRTNGPTVLAVIASGLAFYLTAGQQPPAWVGPAGVLMLHLMRARWAMWPVVWMSLGAILTGWH